MRSAPCWSESNETIHMSLMSRDICWSPTCIIALFGAALWSMRSWSTCKRPNWQAMIAGVAPGPLDLLLFTSTLSSNNAVHSTLSFLASPWSPFIVNWSPSIVSLLVEPQQMYKNPISTTGIMLCLLFFLLYFLTGSLVLPGVFLIRCTAVPCCLTPTIRFKGSKVDEMTIFNLIEIVER